MDIDSGNAHEVQTQGGGWFIGFGDWTRASVAGLRHVPANEPVRGLCVKWYHHPAGHESGNGKPVSEGRTVSALVTEGGEFELEFCTSPAFDGDVRRFVLGREGDYVAWGAGLYHRWRCVKPATIATVRWTPATA